MILLLSDLHLPDEPSPLREGFLHFLEGPARDADAVYILGDLFEYWVGDDVGLKNHAAEVAALAALHRSGVALYFMAGNRDFLIGAGFAAATGVTLLQDPQVLELGGTRTLISHGDRYCTDDVGYQRWRRFSRNRLAQWLFMRLPRRRRLAIAGGLREKSGAEKRNKASAIMDVNEDAIRNAMQQHGVSRMIHGHTHRPADHLLQLRAGARAMRIVLADWHPDHMEYLSVDAYGVCVRRRIETSPPSTATAYRAR
ncbi:UDP-2,3-diacylglucosamine diphosphatase [Solimonas terrae]|uniref:UDP-2,3-diacylglucosamine hydrolase n=1 Tax=Solimonas terrae TaxID=1396819 RepID=A0A6M2BUE5_9GAMM|nr:UDP-2,3-diacylglucosamine diphosphatase [Solimonas terrae]NGY06226.1 UDP-2,3-diacylglucosamine diphosphatase [Solimonas terrae]